MVEWVWDYVLLDKLTLDLNSSASKTYGRQERPRQPGTRVDGIKRGKTGHRYRIELC